MRNVSLYNLTKLITMVNKVFKTWLKQLKMIIHLKDILHIIYTTKLESTA